MRISDLKGIFKTSILTIESIENEYEDYYTIKMLPEKELTWDPEEHGIFKLVSQKVEIGECSQ